MIQVDAVLVPGGGVEPGGSPAPWVRARLDRAMAVAVAGSAPIITLSAGTTHKPLPLDPAGAPLFESVAGARYLLAKGFPAERTLVETMSYDTIGNAFFARVIHTDPLDLRSLTIVTSAFQMPRVTAVFEWVFGLSTDRYRLVFEPVPDVGIDPEALDERRRRERRSLDNVTRLRERHRTLADLHHWLFTQHAAYSLTGPEPEDIGGAIATY
jgi:uncharacterized SAM-binding protein YcdF (DUF218 family)